MFEYGDMQWTSGTTANGHPTTGLGGTAAQVENIKEWNLQEKEVFDPLDMLRYSFKVVEAEQRGIHFSGFSDAQLI